MTTSFDVGGTQTQIVHLASSPACRYEHRVVEIFPELNYLYRVGKPLDAGRYVTGNALSQAIGRQILSRDRRGWQLLQVAKLVRDFETENPAIVVGWGHEICLTTFAAATLARIPRIVFCIRTVNPGYGWADPRFASVLQRSHRRMSAFVDAIIVNSTFLQNDHAGWIGIDRERVGVCANGVAMAELPADSAAAARCDVRRRHGIPDRALVVCNIGRFSAEKGQLSLLDAAVRLEARTSRPVVWLLAGDGVLLDHARQFAAARDLRHVIFVGRTQAVGELLAAADVFVMPSDYEGMPNAAMEAMAAGLPLVSTSRSGITDVARPGIDALYYEPGDVAALAGHLQALADDPARLEAMGRAAKARIAAFDVERLVCCFESILDGISSVRH